MFVTYVSVNGNDIASNINCSQLNVVLIEVYIIVVRVDTIAFLVIFTLIRQYPMTLYDLFVIL